MNYKEQVKTVTTDIVLVNKLLDVSDIWDYLSVPEGEEVYQLFVVELRAGASQDEIDKLGIVYYEPLDVYVMPVTHYGTAWDCVDAVDLRK